MNDELQTAAYNKTRLAPTPSGYLHLGNILSFAITATIAKKAGAFTNARIINPAKGQVGLRYMANIIVYAGAPRSSIVQPKLLFAVFA